MSVYNRRLEHRSFEVYTMLLRFNDGRNPAVYETNDPYKFMSLLFDSEEDQFVKCIECHYRGHRLYSWVLKRG